MCRAVIRSGELELGAALVHLDEDVAGAPEGEEEAANDGQVAATSSWWLLRPSAAARAWSVEASGGVEGGEPPEDLVDLLDLGAALKMASQTKMQPARQRSTMAPRSNSDGSATQVRWEQQ